MPKPRIIQCLCGPNRHAIMGAIYEPGVSTAKDMFGLSEKFTVTESNAVPCLIFVVDALIESMAIHQWCGICQSQRSAWTFEDAPTRFNSMEEAMIAARAAEAAQAATRRFLDSSRN